MTAPIAQYLFNDNANDETGTYNGTPANVTYEALPTTLNFNGKVAIFNGSNSKIDLPNISAISGGNARAIELWLYANTISVNNVFFSQGQANYDQVNILTMGHDTNSKLTLGTYSAGKSISYDPVTVSSFTHVVINYNGGTTYSVYHNAVLKSLLSGTPSLLATTNNNVAIGYRRSLGDLWLNAKIANFRIYNAALSSTEISQHYYDETLQVSVNTLKIPRRDRFPGAI